MSTNKELIENIMEEFRGISFNEFLTLSYSEINARIKKHVNKIWIKTVVAFRIGHMAENTDEFFRHHYLCENDYVNKKEVVILLNPADISCNEQLYKMLKRRLPMVDGPFMRSMIANLKKNDPDLWNIETLFKSTIDYNVFNSAPPQISFTKEEEEEGRRFLERMGIEEGAPFVCFANRDNAYLSSSLDENDWSYHSHRNSDIESFMDAAKYLSDKGYYCIRMGNLVEKPISNSSKRIIDYATCSRTDFGDIYLSAKCRFFIGDPTGIIFVPSMFNIPVVGVNLIPFGGTVPCYSKDLYIPKKFWYRQEERYLTYTELLESRMLEWGQYEFNYSELGVEVINNTPEEIFDVTKEMHLRLSGELSDSSDDISLLERYNSMFTSDDTPYGAPSRIGIDFLNKNRHLFGF